MSARARYEMYTAWLTTSTSPPPLNPAAADEDWPPPAIGQMIGQLEAQRCEISEMREKLAQLEGGASRGPRDCDRGPAS